MSRGPDPKPPGQSEIHSAGKIRAGTYGRHWLLRLVLIAYEFRAVAKLMESEGKSVVTVMKDPKSWQAAWFKADKKLELDFWLKSGAKTDAPAEPATSGHKGHKTVSAGQPPQ